MTGKKVVSKKKVTSTKRAGVKKVERAKTAYAFFTKKNWAKVHKQLGAKATFEKVGKALGEKWRNLSSSSKKIYYDLAKKDKLRASRERKALKRKRATSKKGSSKKRYDGVEDEDEDEFEEFDMMGGDRHKHVVEEMDSEDLY